MPCSSLPRSAGMRPWPPSEVADVPTGLDALEARYFPPPGGTDAAPFSRSGAALPLVDGVEFFEAVRAEVARLAPGDSWYVTGWLFQPGFRFGAGGPTLESLLFAKAAVGV